MVRYIDYGPHAFVHVCMTDPHCGCCLELLSELKQEVSRLQSLLHIEQSIHQAVPRQQVSSKDQTSQELDELSWLHQEYENTVQESLAAEKEEAWEEVDDGYMGSGIK